jgi:hypothetical protein
VGWTNKQLTTLKPLLSEIEYLQDQHLLLTVKSLDGYESYGTTVCLFVFCLQVCVCVFCLQVCVCVFCLQVCVCVLSPSLCVCSVSKFVSHHSSNAHMAVGYRCQILP